MLNKTYYTSAQIKIKKRVDYKIIVINPNQEPEVLDSISGQLLEIFSEGNQLSNIINQKKITEKQQNLIIEKIKLLVEKKYLVTEKKMHNHYFKSEWTLEEVFFELSKRCNLKCKHCYIPKDIEKNELTYDEWKSLVDTVVIMGVSLIKLTGGEAMMVPYFFRLLTYIRNKGIRVRLYTNGSFLTVDTINLLKKADVTELQISLDGATESTHDEFRGTKGNYDRITKVLPYLEKIDLSVILSFTVSDFNEDEIDQFIELAKKYRNIKVVVSPYINYHQTFTKKNMINVTPEIIKKLRICYEDNKHIWSDKTRYYYTFSNKYIGYCGFGLYSAYIDSEGKVLLCPLMNQKKYIVGNIRENSLNQIWKSSEILQEYRKHTLAEIEECNTCQNINSCRSGCRARAHFINGSILTKDPVSCMMFEQQIERL